MTYANRTKCAGGCGGTTTNHAPGDLGGLCNSCRKLYATAYDEPGPEDALRGGRWVPRRGIKVWEAA